MDATLLTTGSEFPSDRVVKDFFTRCGFRVEIALNQAEWLAKTRKLSPEIVVVDLDASWGGDAAVSAFWSELARGATAPALFVLGNAPPSALSRRTGLPPSVCFQKPAPMERLLDAVGLAMAQFDLHRRTGFARSMGCQPSRPKGPNTKSAAGLRQRNEVYYAAID